MSLRPVRPIITRGLGPYGDFPATLPPSLFHFRDAFVSRG